MAQPNDSSRPTVLQAFAAAVSWLKLETPIPHPQLNLYKMYFERAARNPDSVYFAMASNGNFFHMFGGKVVCVQATDERSLRQTFEGSFIPQQADLKRVFGMNLEGLDDEARARMSSVMATSYAAAPADKRMDLMVG